MIKSSIFKSIIYLFFLIPVFLSCQQHDTKYYLDKAQIEINAGNFLSALENCSKAIEID